MENRIEDFFFASNAVSGEPDYGLADTFVHTAEAFANASNQNAYIIDFNELTACAITTNFVCI